MALNFHPNEEQILDWVNQELGVEYKGVEEFKDGVAYCELMIQLFDGCIPKRLMHTTPQFEHQYQKNYKLLEASFEKMGINKQIPYGSLITGNRNNNLMFAEWFKMFYETNHGAGIIDPSVPDPRTGATARTKTPVSIIPLHGGQGHVEMLRKNQPKRQKEARQHIYTPQVPDYLRIEDEDDEADDVTPHIEPVIDEAQEQNGTESSAADLEPRSTKPPIWKY